MRLLNTEVRLALAMYRSTEVREIFEEFAVDGAGETKLLRDKLEALIQQGEVVLIDVRPKLEYDNGHIPGAVTMPIDELVERQGELPRDRRIVAYCRGVYCLYADEAVAMLRSKGYDAYRLDGGWPEWWLEGRPSAFSEQIAQH